jgi:hypothetical protein
MSLPDRTFEQHVCGLPDRTFEQHVCEQLDIVLDALTKIRNAAIGPRAAVAAERESAALAAECESAGWGIVEIRHGKVRDQWLCLPKAPAKRTAW